jgi:hypothetical protein
VRATVATDRKESDVLIEQQAMKSLHIVTWRLKAGIVKQEAAIASQQHIKHVPAAVNQHATIEELLEVVFPVWSVLRLCSQDQQEKLDSWRSELAVSSRELLVSSGNSWLAMRNLHC